MSGKRFLTTVDSHTAGHPTRVITGGLPPLKGRTAADKCDWFAANLDPVRTFLLHEPRGHAAMVGAVLHDSEVADFGAFFLGSYNYLPMCGHATIGLAVTLDHLGLVSPGPDGTAGFSLEVPAGIVAVAMRYDGDRVAAVSFDNVPAYVVARGVSVDCLAAGTICDIAYGGNWYALVDARNAGVFLDPSGVRHAMDVGSRIKAEINDKIDAGRIAGAGEHIHSVLFHDTGREAGRLVSRQLVVLADNKFDRSPCGTGTSARLAQLLGEGVIVPGEQIEARNILDVAFTAFATVDATSPDGADRCRPHIEGLAHITGFHTFVAADDDPLPNGFLCR